MLGTALGGLAAVAAAGAAWVRLAPTNGADWHIDPAEGRPGRGRYLVAQGGDRPPLHLDAAPDAVAAELNRIALATPRTRLVGGEGRFVTYETRTRGFGFPDYTSVRVVPDGEGAEVTVYARLRYGLEDTGVNRARVEDWLARLRAAL